MSAVREELHALVFDVFGTLVDWRAGVARDAAPFLKRHGGRTGGGAADAHAFADAWRRRYVPSMREVIDGRRPFTRLDILHRENLLAVLPEFGIDPQSVSAGALDALNLAWHRLDTWPDVAPALALLHERFVLAPLSNGSIRLLVDLARRNAMPWDAILGAEIARTYKPAPEAYLRSVEALDLRPQQVCMVAAHNADLAAARRCGLRTALVLRPTEHGPRQTGDLVASSDWDFVAPDLGRLAELLLAD
jgi:2-haloacid dehalogenase